MKGRALRLYAIAIVLALAGCTVQADGNEIAGRVVNAERGYSFNAPAGWTQKTESGVLVLTTPDSKACIRISSSSSGPRIYPGLDETKGCARAYRGGDALYAGDFL